MKLTQKELLQAKSDFQKKNPDKFIEIFRSPHTYATDAEVDHKIASVKAAHKGWITLVSGYIEETNGKRAVILHYKP